MDKNSPEGNPRLALLAYKLGYAPVKLESYARLHWRTAEIMVEPLLGPDPGVDDPGCPEEDSRFPLELASYLREIQDAGTALAERLPRNTQAHLIQRLVEAPDAAWNVFQGSWLGRRHRAKILKREASEGVEDMLKESPFLEIAWRDFRRAVREFADSLPESLSMWAALGSHLAASEWVMLGTYSLDPLPEQVSPAPFSTAAALLLSLKVTNSTILGGLGPLDAEDWLDRTNQAIMLHEQIMIRLSTSAKVEPASEGASGSGAVSSSEGWITVTQAREIAQRCDVPIDEGWFGRIAKTPSPRVKSRSVAKRRREVDVQSFISYLIERLKLDRLKAENPKNCDAEDRAKPLTQSLSERSEELEHTKRREQNKIAIAARRGVRESRGGNGRA